MRVLLLFLCLIPIQLWAQEAKLYVKCLPNESVQLKWFTPTLLSEGGVLVYRSVNGGAFERLNPNPIKVGAQPIPNNASQEEKDLVTYISDPNFTWGQNPVMTVVLIQKLIASNEVCAAIGTYFKDSDTPTNASVRYKVVELVDGNEVEIGTTESISTANGHILEGPKNVKTKEKRKKILIGWQEESERYFAVNIYRKEQGSSNEWKKVNELPIVYTGGAGESSSATYQYEDESIEVNGSYDYKLVSIDYFGEEAGESKPLTLSSRDATPPNSPIMVTSEIDEASLSAVLAWEIEPSTDQSGYRVYLSNPNDSSLALVSSDVPNNALYTSIELPSPGNYRAAVAAVDSAGNESERTETEFIVADKIPPAKPQGVTVRSDSGWVSVSWSKNSEPDMKGYLVYRRDQGDKSYIRLTPDALPEAKFQEQFSQRLVAKMEYMVIAVDTNGNRSLSTQPARVEFTDNNAPPIPQIQKVVYDSGIATIHWLPSDCHDLVGYTLYRMSSEDSTWEQLNQRDIPSFSTRYEDRIYSKGVVYSYRINATDTAGNTSAFSAPRSLKVKEEWQAPQFLDVQIDSKQRTQQITLSWKASHPENVLAYDVWYSSDNAQWLPLSGKLNENEYTFKGEAGVYWFKVKLIDKKGKKSVSTVVQTELKDKK